MRPEGAGKRPGAVSTRSASASEPGALKGRADRTERRSVIWRSSPELGRRNQPGPRSNTTAASPTKSLTASPRGPSCLSR